MQILKEAAVEGIGSGVERECDDTAGEPVLRALVIVDELELTDGVDRRMILSDVSGELGIDNRDTVDEDLIGVAD